MDRKWVRVKFSKPIIINHFISPLLRVCCPFFVMPDIQTMKRESEFTYTNGRGGMFALKFDTLHPILQRKHGGDNPHVSNAHTQTRAERTYTHRGREFRRLRDRRGEIQSPKPNVLYCKRIQTALAICTPELRI